MAENKYATHQYVLVNGDFVERADSPDNYIPKLLKKDCYFRYGVYDTAKVQGDIVLFANHHAERLKRSAEKAGLVVPYSLETIEDNAAFFAEATGLKQGRLLFALTADPSDRTGNSCKLYIASSELHLYEEDIYEKGATAILYTRKRTKKNPKLKSLQRLKTNKARKAAEEEGALESIIVNSTGCLTEGSKSNVFAIKNDGTINIVTPPDELVYDGVTRNFVMKLARQNNLTVIEENIKADSLDDYAEIFLTSTSMGVMPVGKILSEGGIVYQRDSFEIVKKMRKYYEEWCLQYIETLHKKSKNK